MFPEMKSLDDMGCWDVMDVKDMPKGAKLVSGRWVFVQKYDENGDPNILHAKRVVTSPVAFHSARASIILPITHTLPLLRRMLFGWHYNSVHISICTCTRLTLGMPIFCLPWSTKFG